MADVIVQQPIRSVYKDGSIVVSNVKSKIDNSTTSYSVVTSWYDGTPMDDSKVDQFGIYSKYKPTGEYLRENKLQWGELFYEVDTVAELRAMTSYIQYLIWIGYYKGVTLNGYYEKDDTPAPIKYFLSPTLMDDDGGSVFIVGNLKLVHDFTGATTDIRYFGAFPNVSQLDEINTAETEEENVTKRIQHALDIGGSIFVPSGRYYINFNQGLFIKKDGTELFGVYGKSILVAGNKSRRNNGYFFRTLNVINFDTLSVSNVVVQNICFERKADNWVDEFDQFYHHINIAGATDFIAKNLSFYGCLGDAICIAGHNSLDSDSGLLKKVFNKNISISECLIDGRNNQNRNGISVVDGSNVRLFKNYFTNFTRHDMPGAIDIEPNNEPDYIIQDIYVYENVFFNIGGNAGVIGCYGGTSPKDLEPRNINIYDNHFKAGGIKKNQQVFFVDFKCVQKDNTPLTPSNNVNIYNNIIEKGVCDILFLFYGVKNISFTRNKVLGGVIGGFVSFITASPRKNHCVNVDISSNEFRDFTASPLVRSSYCYGFKFNNNKIQDGGSSSILEIPEGSENDGYEVFGNSMKNMSSNATYFINKSPLTGIFNYENCYIGNNDIPTTALSNLKNNLKQGVNIYKKDDSVYSGNANYGDLRIFSPSNVAEVNRTLNSRVGVCFKSEFQSANSLWRDLQLIKTSNTSNLPTSYSINGEMVFDANKERPLWFFNGIWKDYMQASSTMELGRVKQSTAVSNITTANATDLESAIALINELKSKLNAKLEADRSSGQQSTI